MKYRFITTLVALVCYVAGYAGNIVVEGVSMKPGETVDLNISLSSAVTEMIGVQFDVTLPEGFSLESIDDKVYKLSSNQTSDMTCNVSDLGNNAFRFVLYSGSLQNLNAGDLISLNLKVISTMASGNYSVSLSNVVFSDIDGNVTKETGVNATINVYLLGDVNGDGEVNEVDAQQILDVSVGILSVSDLAVPEAINVPGGNPSALEVNAQLVLDYSVSTVKPW